MRLVFTGRRCSSISRRSTSTTPPSKRRSAFRCSGSTARTSTSAALPARSPPARSPQGDEVVVAKSGKASRVKRIVTQDGDLETRGRRPGGHAGAGRRGRDLARRHAGRADGAAARRRPVRRQHRLVRRACAAAGPLLHPAHRDRPDQRHGHRPQVPHRRQQFRPRGGQVAGAERGRRLQHLRRRRRSPSTPLPRTAPPAPSS